MKSVILVVSAVLLCLLGCVGYVVWKSHHAPALALNNAAITASDLTPSQSSINTSQPTQPLTNQGQALNVGNNSSLGSSLQTNIGDQAAAGSSSNKPASNPFDPSTFTQYEQYKNDQSARFGDVQTGSGAEAKVGDKVAVVYKGWLTNGTVFDQSQVDKASGKLVAFQFTIGNGEVVQGWDEGLVGMKVGGTRLLVVPPAVGYGATGNGAVPANAVMIFQVQLASIE